MRLFFLPRVFFFLPWGFFFCSEVFLFALRFVFAFLFALWLILLPWQSAGFPLKFWSQRFLIFSTCGHSWELAQTLLIWLAFIILAVAFVDWPVPKMLDIFVCQTSENKALKTQHSATVAREEREHDLISFLVSTLSARSAEHYDRNNVGWKFKFGESTGKLG